ncbi:cannabinoid receptor 2 [Rhinophrynus dorsalis]
MNECGIDTTENTTKCGTQGIDIQCYLILNSKWQKISIAVLCIGAGILCIIENVTVLCMVWTSSHLRKKPSYLFISSLALADLLASLVFSYSFVDFHVFHVAGSPDIFLFKLGGVTASFTASLGSLLLTAFDRYICIHKPSAYKAKVTRKRALIALAIMWTSTITIAFLPIMGWNCCQLEASCSELFPLISNSYLASWIVLVVILQTSIIYSYTYILWKAHNHAVYMEKHNTQSERGQAQLRLDVMLVKTLALVLTVLVVCWSPALFLMIYSLLYSLNKRIKTIFAFCSTLCLVNSMVNPMVYALRSREMRNKLIRGLRKIKRLLRLKENQQEVEQIQNSGHDTLDNETVCNTEVNM